MDKAKIADNFSRYAHLYDKYAEVQNKAASELVISLKNQRFYRILELGCGTGNYTLLLRESFKDAQIKALDISEEMVNIAQSKLKNQNIDFVVADAEKVIPDRDLDLITSNACFQWFNDLEKSLQRYTESLRSGGKVCFSIFGPQTFCELSAALKSVLEVGGLAAFNFPERDGLKAMLKDNFKCVKIDEIFYREKFNNLKELLEKIKYSGIRGNGLGGKVSFSRGLLERLEKAYLDKFKEICVTYQVFFCQGEKQ